MAKRKRRKPRVKQCFNCFTPLSILHRVKVSPRRGWVFVCDICWGACCEDNPHYKYGGMWESGRLKHIDKTAEQQQRRAEHGVTEDDADGGDADLSGGETDHDGEPEIEKASEATA